MANAVYKIPNSWMWTAITDDVSVLTSYLHSVKEATKMRETSKLLESLKDMELVIGDICCSLEG